MNLDNPTIENLHYILEQLANRLNVINGMIMDADHYDINKYDELKFLYDIVMKKGHLTVSETEAFIAELRAIRKN